MKNKKILLMTVVLFWFAQYVYIPYQTPFLNEIHASSQLIGTIIGAYGISQMVLRLPIGVLADYKNRHRILIMFGALSSGLASLFRIIFYNGIGFLVANLFSGLASAMWISFMVLYMSFFLEEEQQKATSQIILANNLGMLLGFITSTSLYNIVGMRIICLFSVISGILGSLFAFFLTEDQQYPTHASVQSLIKICLNKRLLFFSFLALIQQGVQMSTTMSFTSQIIQGLGATDFVVGLSSIIYMFSAVMCARFASTKVCNQLGARFWIPFVFIVNAIYCITIPLVPYIFMICCLQILPGMSTGILFSYLTSEAMKEVPKEKKSTAMGCFQSIYALGMTVFPIMCGQIASDLSMQSAYHVLALICLLGTILAVCYYRHMIRKADIYEKKQVYI